MEVLQETTRWETDQPNHTYLVDGNKMLGYIKVNTTEPIMMKTPMMFDRARRKFDVLITAKGCRISMKPFPMIKQDAVASTVKEVIGSKGHTYYVDTEKGTCTCLGNKFKGTCKHVQ